MNFAGAVQLLLAALVLSGCTDSPSDPGPNADARVGEWHTWVIASGQALRPAAPLPDTTLATRAELEQVRALQSSVRYGQSVIDEWDGPPTTVWTNYAVEQLEFYWAILPAVRIATPVRAARILAILHVALYDATVAVWDAKYAYQRRGPWQVDQRITLRVRAPATPSYPSEHAAAAAAAAVVLRYAFPDAAVNWDSLAIVAGESRIAAGVAYPSDVQAGAQIGRSVAQAVLARARSDGSDLAWEEAIPSGPDKWRPTPPRYIATPFDPMAGKWRPWVLNRADAFRPPPPPAIESAQFKTDLQELQQLAVQRTAQQADLARYWATGPPPLRWSLMLESDIHARGLSTPEAARAHALLSTVMHDAMLACWDAKYYYWLARPITIDPALSTVTSTPPFPSYPSGHSTMSYAAYQVMALLFPERANDYRRFADEASVSRVYAGIHYRFDTIVGDSLGARVGREAVRQAGLR